MNLQSFKPYLTEAAISKENLEKGIALFVRFIEKKLATKLFRYAGPKGYCEIKNGLGILFFYNKTKAMRFNYVKGEIVSITLWNNFKLGADSDFTIDLGGLGLASAAKHLVGIIKAPKIGVIQTYAELAEGYMTEATRISPADFYTLIKANLPAGMSINSVSWATITDIAIGSDRQVPTAVRETKIPGTKGDNTRFDLSKLLSSNDADTPAKDVEPTYYIKVSKLQDGKFQSVKGDPRANELLTQIKTAIDTPDVDKEMKNPDTLFGLMSNLCQLVARKSRNSLVIIGGPGVGKTHVVKSTLKSEGLVEGTDFIMVKGKITTAALYQTLFMHRKGTLLVFDDCDSCDGSTIINTNLGDISIENLYKIVETMGYIGIHDPNNDQYVIRSNEDIDVLSFSETEGTINKKMNYIMKHKVEKEMFEITCDGNTVKITDNHSVIVLRNGNVISVIPSEILKTDELILNYAA